MTVCVCVYVCVYVDVFILSATVCSHVIQVADYFISLERCMQDLFDKNRKPDGTSDLLVHFPSFFSWNSLIVFPFHVHIQHHNLLT